jgi:hypothetical protein
LAVAFAWDVWGADATEHIGQLEQGQDDFLSLGLCIGGRGSCGIDRSQRLLIFAAAICEGSNGSVCFYCLTTKLLQSNI